MSSNFLTGSNFKNYIFDAHGHIQFAAYDKDRDEVIKRAQNAGVKMITVGTQTSTSKAAIEIAHKYPDDIWATVGLHPIHTEESYHDPQELGSKKGFTSRSEDFDYEYYKKLASDPKVVAIGECGLDYFNLATSDKRQAISIKDKQKEIFSKQVKLAEEVKKPLMIHCRPSKGTDDAYGDILKLITNHSRFARSGEARQFLIPNIMHFFAGSLEIAKKFLEAGSHFTFGGVITFTRDYDDLIKLIPLGKIMVETDCPYVAPEPYRGKRNEPTHVIEVVKKLAELRGVGLEKVAEITYSNCRAIFKI